MRELYPPIEPFATERLRVSDLHELRVEQCGTPDGIPAVFLHGGPGGGISPKPRRFFDPAAFRIVLFDQRGCGESTPHSELRENTTWDLVADVERIREHLGIDRWLVFGGSWGSTLALAYAEAHPEHVTALVLRGIFMLRPHEIRWFYQEGASFIFPDAWADYIAVIPPAERDDLVGAFHRRLTGDDPGERARAAEAWARWEATTSFLVPDPAIIAEFTEPRGADAVARIECHYFVNGGFLSHPDQLLDDVDRIRHIPAVIVQGRYDLVCPMTTAWDLHQRWPEASFEVSPRSGHGSFEAENVDALVRATDRFRDLLSGRI